MKTFFLLLIFSIAIPVQTYAAEFFLEAEIHEVGPGQRSSLRVMLNPKGESINAVQGTILFPPNLQIEEIQTGDSIISLWLEGPEVISEDKISFTGITPGGFAGVLSPFYAGGRPGHLFTIVFSGKEKGGGIVRFVGLEALLHDGQGTPTVAQAVSFPIQVTEIASRTPETVVPDSIPPESFIVEVAQDKQIFEGKYFLVFATQDKGTGVDHYQVLEKPPRWSARGIFKKEEWNIQESPYVLQDQKQRNIVLVKAIDKAGNEEITTILPKNNIAWYENILFWGIVIDGVIILSIFLLPRRQRNHYVSEV